MTVINDPTVVAEVTALYLKYEEALSSNNIEVMDNLFWDARLCSTIWSCRKPLW